MYSCVHRNSSEYELVTPPFVEKSMKITPKNSLFLVIIALSVGAFACKTLGIDDSFTFNLDKNFSFPVPKEIPVGVDAPEIPLPLAIDSADLAKNKTGVNFIKSVKLTKLDIVSTDPTYPLSSFDTMVISVRTSTLPKLVLAYYSHSQDKIILTNADFVDYAKSSDNSFLITARANKAPADSVLFNGTTTISITASPLP